LIEAAPGGFLLVDQVKLVGADIVRAEPFRGLVEIAGNLRHTLDLGLLRLASVVAQLQVFEIALT
jgi:hypothetical protein